MTTLHRIAIGWSGGSVVGTAVSILHFDGSDNAAPPVTALLNAYQAMNAVIPNNVTITVPGTGDTIDDTTGQLTGVWTAAGGGTTNGSGQTDAPAGVGACIGLLTGGIVNGRKLRGRTFIVPLARDAYDATGTLSSGGLTVLNTFAASLLASGPLAVWHRPTTAGGSDGTSYGVIATRLRDKVAFLSSRRD